MARTPKATTTGADAPRQAPAEAPSMLSYERSLHPTDAVFTSSDGLDGKRSPVRVNVKTALGTKGHYERDVDKAATFHGGNPQRIHEANLPPEHDTLHVGWSLAVTGSSLAPASCDQPAYRDLAEAFMAEYVRADGFATIARRVAQNVANGRWAWRNRMFASTFPVSVDIEGHGSVAYDALGMSLVDFGGDAVPGVDVLAEAIAAGLRGERVTRIKVSGSLAMMAGCKVFPSQEFVDGTDDAKEIGRHLFHLPYAGEERCAAMHEQKIGNALRTYDTWHADGHPLPVNPYGQDRATNAVLRAGRKGGAGAPSFYQLAEKGLPDLVAALRAGGEVPGDAHFVAAVLVRGGVFGMVKKTDKAEKAAAGEPAAAPAEAGA